jgi:glutaredoxin
VREFLSDNKIPFEDRNIRGNEGARYELVERTGKLVVPQLFWRDQHILGFDPAALDELATAYRASLT